MTRLDRGIALNIALMPMPRSSRVMTNLPPIRHWFGPLVLKIKAIEARGGAAEQIGLFRGTRVLGEQFACVPERCVAVRTLVHGEVALEHAAIGAERFDAGLDIGFPRGGESFRRRWIGFFVEIPTIDSHRHPSKFDDDVRAGGEVVDGFGPRRENFVAFAGIFAYRQ